MEKIKVEFVEDITGRIYELPKIDRMHGQGRCGLKINLYK